MTRIAVVRLDKIGDLILTTPAIASLKAAFPGSKLTAIVSPYNKVVLEHSPLVNEIWEWKWSFENILRLRRARFDKVIVFSPTTPSYLIALLSGAVIRAGYVYQSRILTREFSKIALSHRIICPVDQKDVEGSKGVFIPHEVEQNLEVIRALEISESSIHPALVVPVIPDDLEWAREKLNRRPTIGIHLSEAWLSTLPDDFLVRLVAELSQSSNLFITYGPQEAAWADRVAFPGKVKRFSNPSFSQWAALFHEAKAVIATNTGAVHVAASQGVPVVAVFEPRFFAYHEKRWAPWQVPSLILRKNDPELLHKIVQGVRDLAGERCWGQSLRDTSSEQLTRKKLSPIKDVSRSAPTNVKKISVQICSHNRKALLREALRSLFDQSLPKEQFEVVVVDDGSTDGTMEMVQSLNPPIDLVFLRQEKEGLAVGRNKGIRKAKGEIILFIDDDVLADSRLLEEHVRFHKRFPMSVVKGWVNHVDQLERPKKPKWTMRDYSRAFFWTSNVSVEKKYLVEAGLFDESFKEYGWEDLELGLRVKELGLKSRINRKAIGHHYKRSMTAADVPSTLSQAEAKGRTAVVFVKKNPGWRARLSTGVHPLRLWLDSILSSAPLIQLYQRGVPPQNGSLSTWSKFCVRCLATARYFKAIRRSMKAV